MPFAYYGAKHNLAASYPRPRHRVVVEPFAGSAAYSVHHAATIDHAILYDLDAQVVELWHEVQQMTVADVDRIGCQLDGDRIDHPLLAGLAGGEQMKAVLAGKTRQVTPWMHKNWPGSRARIVAALPHIRRWEIHHGNYAEAPDIDATWFIDPPYQENGTMAGAGYRHGAMGIDFDHLGSWCRTRRGFAIVCEQSPAEWLPFFPFATQANGSGRGLSVARHELIWRSDLEQPSLFDEVAS